MIKTITITLAILSVFSVCQPGWGQSWDGNGVEGDPYLIYTAEDMQAIGADPNYWDAHFLLCADIDLGSYTGTSFNIIGIYVGYNNPSNRSFTGVFDGEGHTISNFRYTATDMDCVGLFRVVEDPNAIIRDVNIEEPNILSQGVDVLVCSPLVGALYDGTILNCNVKGGQVKGEISVAGVAGQSSGVISNCRSTCSVYGTKQVGGLVGYNRSGTIDNSSFTGNITATGYHVGGLAGISDGDGVIRDSFFSGSIVAVGYAGGLVGYHREGEIYDSYAIGIISSSGGVGGLVGRNSQGEIYDSYAICDVYGTATAVGGLVGSGWYGKIERCFAECSVNGQGQVGGLCGDIYHTYVINCYATGNATGLSNVGGLIGYYNTAYLSNCYSATIVTGESNTGGLVGSGGGGYATNCFWDIESSGQIFSSMGTGKTTQQMKKLATFVSWACDNVWTINENIDYPRLYFEQKEGLPLTPYSYWDHTGEPNDLILISTAEQLLALGTMPCQWDKHFVLLNDIDLQGQGTTIGNSTFSDVPFTGTFNGNHNSIFNLSIYNDNGLFGHISSPAAVVRNLTLIKPHIEAGSQVGSLVGYLENGLVTDCHVIDGYVEGWNYVGGLIGDSNESLQRLSSDAQVFGNNYVGGLLGYGPEITIRDCTSSGSVEAGIDPQFNNAGGLTGSAGDIINCQSSADVNCSKPLHHGRHGNIGGLTGLSFGKIHNSKATGNLSCNGSCSVGGLAAFNSGMITDSSATGSIRGGGECGGLVGVNSGQIISCNASGNVTNHSSSSTAYVGGLVGKNSNTISNCSALGKVQGYNYIGGLVGVHSGDLIDRCHAEGEVIGTICTGGLIGYHSEADVSNSYALGNVSCNNRAGGLIGQITNHHGTTSVIDCYATGEVNGIDDIGGLVGFVYMGYEGNIYISRCYSSGDVNAVTIAGGLLGRVEDDDGAIISECFSTSNLNLTSEYGGGLIGLFEGANVTDCYAKGNVIGSAISRYLGGLIGYKDNGNVSDSYATGKVEGLSYIGGLIGSVYGPERVYDCFWDIETGGPDNGIGTGLPTSQMQTEYTFTNAEWNFVNTWAICEGTNYAKLVWSIPVGDFLCPDGVNFLDYAFLAERWQNTDYGDVGGVELTGDGKIDLNDFAWFAQYWRLTGCGDCGGADYTGEGDVDLTDLEVLSGSWLVSDYGDCEGAELTGDGKVGVEDLGAFVENWLKGL